MKTFYYLGLFAFLLLACDINNYESKELVGKWDNSYEVSTKDSTGKWSEWYTINTFVALPQLEFTAKGKVLWDGEPATTCCHYLTYELKNDNIVLGNPTNSELCNCVNCPEWKIEKLTSEVLEINQCYTRARYFRAK